MSLVPSFRPHLVAAAVSLLVAAPLQASAQAGAAAAVATHAYDLPAQPLNVTAARIAGESGVRISIDADLARGITAAPVRGHLTAEAALQQALAGSGLELVRTGSGVLSARRVAQSGGSAASSAAPAASVTLNEVRVVGATEGSGSYTTNLSNTATKLNLSLRETPQSVTVMTRKRIEDQGLSDVTEVLDQTVGVHYHNTNLPGADQNQIYSRGFVLQNYQVNGVPRGTRFGFQDEMADTLVYDRAEIVRGASGLLSGIGEPSGAINLVRKLPTREFQGNAAVQLGSWDRRRAEFDIGGPLSASGQVRGRLVAGKQENGSFIERAKARKEVLYGVVEADLSPRTILTAGFEYQASHGTGAGDAYSGAPIILSDGSRSNLGRSTNLALDWANTARTSTGLFSTLEHYFDNEWRLRADVEHVRRKYDAVLAAVYPTSASGAGNVDGFRYYGEPRQTSLTLHANGPYRLFGRTHELVVGASYMKADEKGYGTKSFGHTLGDVFGIIRTGSYPVQDLGMNGATSATHDEQSGLYAATRLSVADGWSVILGSRLSNWKTRVDSTTAANVTTRGDTRKGSGEFTPYAGVVYDLTDTVSLYTSYTDIFQPATVYDAAGQLLDPAEGSNVEAGVKAAFFDKRLNVSAAAFSTKKDNVPEYVPGVGGTVSRGATGKYIYQAIDGTKTTGFELEVAGEPARGWQLAGGYSYNRPKDAAGNDRLIYLPKESVKLFTAYQPAGLLPGLTLGGNLRWQGNIRSTTNSRNAGFQQGGLTVIDLMAQYKINRDLTLTLNVNNVFDKVYYTDINVSGFYGTPRNANVTLRYAFR